MQAYLYIDLDLKPSFSGTLYKSLNNRNKHGFVLDTQLNMHTMLSEYEWVNML